MKLVLILSALLLSSGHAFADYKVGDKVGDVKFLYNEDVGAPYVNSWWVSFPPISFPNQAVITGTGKTADFIGVYAFSCNPDQNGGFIREWKYAVNFGSVDSSIVPQQAIDNVIKLGCKK